MIQIIDKPLKELKIGIIGFRRSFIKTALNKFNLSYTYINNKNIEENEYDIIFGSGVYNILSEEFIKKPKYGCFFIHESPLPEGRGHAPIQWALENKRKNLTLSLFKVLPGIDDGNIVYQHNKEINKFDTVESIEQKRLEGITECFELFLEELSKGVIVLRKQTGKSSYNPKRNPSNSEIKSIPNVDLFWDELRMCDNEKYPAFFKIGNKKITLKYSIDDYK
jgi:methionyl-tRNA formyltransferase